MAGKKRAALPGFRLSLGYTTFFLSALVLLPLAGCVLRAASLSWSEFCRVVTDPVALAAYKRKRTAAK